MHALCRHTQQALHHRSAARRNLALRDHKLVARAHSRPTTQPPAATTHPSADAQQDTSASRPHAAAPWRVGAAAAALAAAGAMLTVAPAAHAASSSALYTLAELDAATAHKLELFLRPLLTLSTLLYIVRIPMTWYPSLDANKLPWVLAYAPTEPVLKATRKVIPLVGGVDVTPIVWVALISFANEILLGPQGILLLIQRESAL